MKFFQFKEKIKELSGAVDMTVMLIILVIMASVAIFVFQGIGDKTIAASEETQGYISQSNDYNSGNYVPPIDNNNPDTEEEPEVPSVPDEPEVPEEPEEEEEIPEEAPLTEEELEAVAQNEVLKADIGKQLAKGKNYNLRGIKPTRHELFMIQEYTECFNGRSFDGKSAPVGIIREVFEKYKIL